MPSLHTLLARSSRTFAVGIEIPPEPLREEITVAYVLQLAPLRRLIDVRDQRVERTRPGVAVDIG